jgi:hypothetical protein
MSDTDTYEVETQFGPAEIETYECDSCGNRVAYENTVTFSIGEREGRACEHCEETGPVSWPQKTLDFLKVDIDYGMAIFGVLFTPLALLVIFEKALSEDEDFEQGILFGWLVMIVWVVTPLLALIYL